MAALTLVAVVYLGVVAVLAVLTGLGAPLETAMRTGWTVGRLGAGLVAVLDAVTLLRGHRPADLATHAAYAVFAVLLPWLLTTRAVAQSEAVPSPWVVAAASAATAVVLVRLAQTWA
jgi:hypothetical protein